MLHLYGKRVERYFSDQPTQRGRMNPFSAEHEKIAQLHHEAEIHAALQPLRTRDRARVLAALKTIWQIARAWILGVGENPTPSEISS
jgi:hypothetical protein